MKVIVEAVRKRLNENSEAHGGKKTRKQVIGQPAED